MKSTFSGLQLRAATDNAGLSSFV